MESTLRFDSFFERRDLLNAHWMPEDPLKFLGKSLVSFLDNLLESLEVFEEPVLLGKVEDGAELRGRVYIAEGASVERGALVQGPCYVGPGSEVRHGSYIRGNTYVGKDCVVGHVTEVKGSVFLDGAKAGHFAYVGDSVLGRGVNLGAGTKLANLNLKKGIVSYTCPLSGQRLSSGLRKFGAILGDGVATGCNSVLSPGALLLPQTAILPCVHHRGTLLRGWAT